MRFKLYVAFAVLLAHGSFALQARANHFEIALTVSDGNNKQTGNTETEPPRKAGDVPVRPVPQVAFGVELTVK